MKRSNGYHAGSAFQKLSSRQVKFLVEILEGKSQGKAYAAAYGSTMTGRALRANAARALRTTSVRLVLQEVRDVIGAEVIKQAARRGRNLGDVILETIEDIALEPKCRVSERLKAAIALAKMIGLFEPLKTDEAARIRGDDPLRRLEEILGGSGHEKDLDLE